MKNKPNEFGDSLAPISVGDLTKRANVLGKLFKSVVIEHPDLSAYYELMLMEMTSEAKALLFIRLSRWLKTQTGDFSQELDAQQANGELLTIFETALADWTQNIKFAMAARASRIRDVYVTQLFPQIGALTIPVSVIHQESHHANHVDMVYVCAIAAAVDARQIFEFGTYRGQTTTGLAATCPSARIYTLNLPIEADPRYAPYIGMFIGRSPHRERITQIFADSRSFDTTPYLQSMDYIFIDGDHSYEGVKNDTEKAIQMLKPGGVIVWHDYAAKSPGVLQYLAEFSQARPLFRLRKTCIAVYVDGVDPESAELHPMEASLEDQEYGDDLA